MSNTLIPIPDQTKMPKTVEEEYEFNKAFSKNMPAGVFTTVDSEDGKSYKFVKPLLKKLEPEEKKVSFAPTMDDFKKGGASTFSEKASKYTGIQRAKQLVFIKGIDIDILNVEKDILDLLYQIELLEFSNRNTENSGLPAEIKLEHTYGNGLAVSKLYCQIEVLNSQKRILEHTLQTYKKQYMELLKV